MEIIDFNKKPESEIIEPHPLLIEYINKTVELDYQSDRWSDEFVDSGEWHYIPSSLDDNIFLLRQLNELGILSDEVNICDCGIGLGTIMFDIFLQSKEFTNKKFTFTGIEKHTKYTNFVKENLLTYWEDKLDLIEGDILESDYSKYNLIYSYSPFNKADKLMSFYQRILETVKPETIIIGLDHYRIMNYGQDYGDLIERFKKLKVYQLNDQIVFKVTE